METVTVYSDVIQKGTRIGFTTKNTSDVTEWIGDVIGENVNWEIAQAFTDLQTYHAAVRRNDPSLDEDYKQMTYFILKLESDSDLTKDNSTKKYAFAKEWITNGTVTLYSGYTEYLVKVFLAGNNTVDQVLNILRSSNVKCVEHTT